MSVVTLIDTIVRKARFWPPRQRMLATPEIVADLKPLAAAGRIVPHHELESLGFKPPAPPGTVFLADVADFL